jgi:hypothetical protein
MKKPVGNFPTQTACRRHFAAIREKYAVGDRLQAADQEELAVLLARHPDHAQLIGAGLDHFEVVRDPLYGTRGFAIVRADGTRRMFSLQACVTGRRPASVFQEIDFNSELTFPAFEEEHV